MILQGMIINRKGWFFNSISGIIAEIVLGASMRLAAEEEMGKVVEEPAVSGSLLESKTSHLHDLLQEKLEQAFHKETSTVVLHDIIKIASEHAPVDLAYAASRLPSQAR